MAATMTFNAPISSASGRDASEPASSIFIACSGRCPEESPADVPNDDMNSKADNIIGDYLVDHKGEKSKVKVFKNADGSYTAQVFWVQNRTEKDGSVRKDSKNPDKSLRNVDCD